MSATTTNGIPFPSLTDAPNGPSQMQSLATAADALVIARSSGALARLAFTPGSTLSTPTSVGSATWFTVGSVTVPTWATQAFVSWSLYSVTTPASATNTTAVVKVGSVSGSTRRILPTGSTGAVTTHFSQQDAFTGLSTGSQSVTVLASLVVGSLAYTVDVNSYFSAIFNFLP